MKLDFSIICLLAGIISGCSTSSGVITKDQVPSNSYLKEVDSVQGSSVYFRLIKNGNGYSVDKKLYSRPGGGWPKGVYVNMANLRPVVFEGSVIGSCMPLLRGCSVLPESLQKINQQNYHIDETRNKELFMQQMSRLYGPFVKAETNTGNTIIMNTFGLFSLAVGDESTYSFDWGKYWEALGLALMGSGMDPSYREKIINTYNKAIALKSRDVNTKFNLVRNESGFIPIKGGFDSLISATVEISSDDLSDANLLDQRGSPLISLQKGREITWKVRECSLDGNFVMDVFCPDMVVSALNSSPVVNVSYSVKSMKLATIDYRKISGLSSESQNLKMEVQGGKIYMSNKTGKYIEVSSVSFYWGDRISTKNYSSDNKLILPPYGVSDKYEINMSTSFNWGYLEKGSKLKYRKVKKKDLVRRKIFAGISARYKITDDNREKTLPLKSKYFTAFELCAECEVFK